MADEASREKLAGHDIPGPDESHGKAEDIGRKGGRKGRPGEDIGRGSSGTTGVGPMTGGTGGATTGR